MKKKLLFLLMVIPFIALSQDLPINRETRKVEYSELVQVRGDKNELFAKAENWAKQDADSVHYEILAKDKEEGYLILNGLSHVTMQRLHKKKIVDDEVPMLFTAYLTFKDNQYQYWLTDIYFESAPSGTTNVPIENTLLSKKGQYELFLEGFRELGITVSDETGGEPLDMNFSNYQEYKSKGDSTILKIIAELKDSLAEGIDNE